jgi:hypothetical protein
MAIEVFVFLLVFFLILSLALLCRLCWLYLQPSHSKAGRRRAMVHRLLRPRTPLDCPICRFCSSDVRPASVPVRPWREVKSRRGAPKRIHTEGLAYPNQQCAYFGITDAHIHALVGDGKHGRAEHIQTFRGPACRTTFSARRHTPLYRLKTPSHQIAMVLSARAFGLDASASERVFDSRQATITTWLTRAGKHAEIFHERCLRNLHIPHLQLDELRTRLCCATQVLWLWLDIDPCTKILPVLQLGPRRQNMAHLFIHSLRQSLAPGCLPLFTSDGLNLSFSALTAHFGQWLAFCRRGRNVRKSAGGGWPDLRPGEEKLSAAQVGSCHACDAPWNRGRSQSRPTGMRPFWSLEHRLDFAGQSDHPPWKSRPGSSHLGDVQACPTAARPSGVVARLLSRMSRPHASLRVALAQPRERGGNLLPQRSRQRTPAMAAGRTTRRWTACEVLSGPLPPVSA